MRSSVAVPVANLLVRLSVAKYCGAYVPYDCDFSRVRVWFDRDRKEIELFPVHFEQEDVDKCAFNWWVNLYPGDEFDASELRHYEPSIRSFDLLSGSIIDWYFRNRSENQLVLDLQRKLEEID